MTRSQIFKSVTLIAVVCLALATTTVQAQLYTIPWYTIDNGGGYSSGGNFELEGTIGQHDAGPVMTGGNFSVRGGFWVGAQRTVHRGSRFVPGHCAEPTFLAVFRNWRAATTRTFRFNVLPRISRLALSLQSSHSVRLSIHRHSQ